MASSCTRTFTPPYGYVAGQPVTVELDTVLDGSLASTHIVEDTYPAGWAISSITPGSGSDNGTSVRWFFLDSMSRTLSYVATPPGPESGPAVWGGTIETDGPGGYQSEATGGETTLDDTWPHPADTGEDMAMSSAEVLAYANAFLSDNDAVFPGISSGSRAAYVLRASAIFLARFDGAYEDLGTTEPIDSTAHPARWQSIP